MSALLVPRHSWPGCVVCVCVFGLGFWLRHASPGWGVGLCVFVCALRLYPVTPGWVVRCGCVCLGWGFGCAPPLLAGVLGGVCVRVRAPLEQIPLLAGVCAGVVCARARVSAAPRHSWLRCYVVCVFVCALRLYPATPGWGVWCVCVLGLGFPLRPATPGRGVRVCVLCVRPPLVPRNSWLGCVV